MRARPRSSYPPNRLWEAGAILVSYPRTRLAGPDRRVIAKRRPTTADFGEGCGESRSPASDLPRLRGAMCGESNRRALRILRLVTCSTSLEVGGQTSHSRAGRTALPQEASCRWDRPTGKQPKAATFTVADPVRGSAGPAVIMVPPMRGTRARDSRDGRCRQLPSRDRYEPGALTVQAGFEGETTDVKEKRTPAEPESSLVFAQPPAVEPQGCCSCMVSFGEEVPWYV